MPARWRVFPWRAGGRMNHHARRFVNDHQIFIFMDDLDRNFFRSNGCSRQRGEFDFYFVVRASLVKRTWHCGR